MKRLFITFAVVALIAAPVKAASLHTVKDGESLWGISKRYGVSFEALVEANPQVTSLDLIYPGAKITVPDKGQTAAERVKRYYDAKRVRVENAQNAKAAKTDVTPAATVTAAPASATPSTATAMPAAADAPFAATRGVSGGDEAALAAMEARLLELCNMSRAAVGIAPLSVDDAVARVARYKAADMGESASFDHNSLVYGSPFEMLKSFGVDYRQAGENIAKGFSGAEDVYTAWLMSEGHRANVLDPGFTRVGVGCCTVGGVMYWALIFIG